MGPVDLAGSCAQCLDRSLPFLLGQMLKLFTVSILLCLIIAVATLALAQLLRPFLTALAQFFVLKAWHRRTAKTAFEKKTGELGEHPPLWLKRSLDFVEVDNIVNQLDFENRYPKPRVLDILKPASNGRLMKMLADAASLVVARPSKSAGEYLQLTTGVSDEDRDTILWLDVANRIDPARVASLMSQQPSPPPRGASAPAPATVEKNSGFAEAIAAAQDAVSTGVERQLDVMQIGLDGLVAFYSRILTIVIGVAIADSAFSAVSSAHSWIAVVLGAIGGLLASLLYDIAGSYVFRRK